MTTGTLRTESPVKALFFDIDGTLVSLTTHQIAPSTVSALTQARQRGVQIFISTGRPFCIINNLSAIASLIDGYITVNGAYCFLGDGEVRREEICCHPLPADLVSRLLADARRHDYACVISGEKDIAVFNEKPVVHDVFGGQLNVRLPYTLDAEAMIRSQRVLQISPFVTAADEPRLLSLLPACQSGRWHEAFTDITSPAADKGQGLLAVASHLGLGTAQTMAFGDGGNDVAIIRQAGIGVAMAGAVARLKDEADFITHDAADDGIEFALRQFGVI